MTPLIFLKVMGLVLLEYVPCRPPCHPWFCLFLRSACISLIFVLFFRPVLDQNMYYLGAKLTSAGFASALVNILPAVTFIMALLLRMERLRLRSLHSQAKIFGTVCTVAGAVLMVLYHGPVVEFPWTRGHHHAAAEGAAATQSGAAWLNGVAMVIGSCVTWAGFFILQVHDTSTTRRRRHCIFA